jgi:hypothetical protein
MSIAITIGTDAIDVRLTTWDRIWALRSALSIPLSDVTAVSVRPRDELRDEILGWRLGGTYVPRRAIAGNYSVRGRRKERQFWCVYRDGEVLAIETSRPNRRYVVLQTAERAKLAATISERIR